MARTNVAAAGTRARPGRLVPAGKRAGPSPNRVVFPGRCVTHARFGGPCATRAERPGRCVTRQVFDEG